MRGRQDLHVYLACPPETAEFMLDAEVHDLFRVHVLPKKGRPGGNRVVWEVRDRHVADVYKGFSRRIRIFLETSLQGFPHPAAHGYVPGRSTRTNALRHVGATAVLKADIQDFFQSISKSRVIALLESAGVRPAAADVLAEIATWEDHLPLGLHSSPILANAVCNDLDRRLSALCPGGIYTRYADDLSFSGPHLPTKAEVVSELARDGFRLAEHKWRLVSRGRGLFVTGLSIEDGVRPRVPRKMKRRLRQEVYYANKFGIAGHFGACDDLDDQKLANRVYGTIQYVRGIEPELGLRLHDGWNRAMMRSGFDVNYPPVIGRTTSDALFLVDESEFVSRSVRRLALCLVAVDAPRPVRARVQVLADDLGADPYSSASKKGQPLVIHWDLLSEDDRTTTSRRVRALPVRVFVAFGTLAGKDRKNYNSTYCKLLRVLLTDRFLKYDRGHVEIHLEENSKTVGEDVHNTVADVYGRLGGRKPVQQPICRVVSKAAEPALSLPDSFLGVFQAFARSKELAEKAAGEKKKQLPGELARSRFEQLRDKIKAVYNVDTGAVYSRTRPFQPL